MDRLEMAEKLVEKCGITYEEAGDVLREANYDLLEAMIILEKRGKTGNAKNSFSTGIPKANGFRQSKSAADAESFGEFVKITCKNLGDRLKDILKYRIFIIKNGRELAYLPLVLGVLIICITAGLGFAAVLISLAAGCSYDVRKVQ